MRTPYILWNDWIRSWIQITQWEERFQELWKILKWKIAFSAADIQLLLKTMLWDIYEKMLASTQKACRPLLKEMEDKWDIGWALLEAIALFNIQSRVADDNEDLDIWDAKSAFDFMMSEQSCGFSEYKDIFHQVNHFRNNGKLEPPEMYTMWRVENACQDWRSAIVALLDEYKQED